MKPRLLGVFHTMLCAELAEVGANVRMLKVIDDQAVLKNIVGVQVSNLRAVLGIVSVSIWLPFTHQATEVVASGDVCTVHIS